MAQLVMTLAPPITVFTGFLFLGEKLTFQQIIAISIIIAGIVIAMIGKEKDSKLNFKVPVKGFLLALGGAAGQAVGFVLSKKGIGEYDAMSATQIRAITGALCFYLLVTFLKRWSSVKQSLYDSKGVKFVLSGSMLGPVIGVSLSLFAVQHTEAGVAATLMALVPIFIIVPYALMFKKRITLFQILGAVISVLGCVILFWKAF
jgi:drug/metabolite transporter (DMT)-like permease